MAGGIQAIMKELTKGGFLDLTRSSPAPAGRSVRTWRACVNRNPEVVRPLDNPYSQTGGIAVLWGNIAKERLRCQAAALSRRK